MKKVFLLLVTIPAIISLTTPAFSINEYFRSVNSGNWNSTGTWQMSTNSGGTWIAATLTPNETSGLIIIQSPNTVTVTVNVNADQLTVSSGATLSINSAVTLSLLDGASEDLILISGAAVSGSGTLQTKGSNVYLNVHVGSSLTAALKVNTGITTVYESAGTLATYLDCPVTVDAGAVLGASIGSYTIQFNKTLLVNGTLNGGTGSILRIAGPSVTNNGFISGYFLFFDSTTTVTGTGSFTSRIITIPFSGTVTLLSNMTFSPLVSMTMNPFGDINLNSFTLTFGSGSFILRNDATVSNSGIFQTKGTVSLIIRNLSNFNCPLKVNTGTTTAYDDGSSFTAIFKGTVTVDAAAILKVNTGAFLIQCNSSLTNNGTITGTSGASLRIKGSPVANTGSINVSNIYFDTSMTLGGSGSFTGNSMSIAVAANVSISSDVTFSPTGSFVLNGTLSGSYTFRFAGSSFANNGSVSVFSFVTETGSHNVQGTGSCTATISIINGSVVTLTGNFQIKDVLINSGGSLNLSTFKLLATGSNPIVNNGTFNTTSGSVEYNGITVQNISASSITYNKLRINNSSGTTLLSNVTVNDTLSVISGDVDLSGNILTISSTGYLSETAGNTIGGVSGYVTITRSMNAPSSLNAGGLGAVITSSANLGTTEIRRGHTIHSGLSGNSSIARYYDIIPTNNSGLNATLVFKYDESELNGYLEPGLILFSSTNSGLNWAQSGGTPDPPGNTVTLSSINSFSRISASKLSAVPAQLKLFMEAYYDLVSNRLNMKDTVTAYLRTISSPFGIVDSARSVIDSVSFTGNFLFVNAQSGNYYIQLKHRNSLETWSRTGGEAYTFGSELIYDFTTDSAKAYGNNMKQVASKWSVFSGDVDQNGIINLNDIVEVSNAASVFAAGYVVTDVNGDRTVNLNDIIFTSNNSNLFVTKETP